MNRRMQRLSASLAGLFVALVAWQAITSLGIVNQRILLGPLALLERFQTLSWGSLGIDGAVSMYRVTLGFLVGSGLGVVFGVWIGLSQAASRMLTLPLELLRPIPPLAWIPLALIWFGTGNGSKVFVIALGSFFVLLTNTEKGVRHLDSSLIRQARSYGLKGLGLIRRIVLPGIVPDLMVGASIALSISFASVVAAEMLGADSGLGYLLMQARVDGDFGLVLVAIISIACLAYVTDVIVRRLVMRHPEAYDH